MNEMYVLDTLRKVLGSHTKIDSNGNIQFYCPSCKHRKQKLAVNARTLQYHCWVCDIRGNNIASLLWSLGHKNEATTLKVYSGKVNISDFDNLFNDNQQNVVKQEKVTIPRGYRNLFINKQKPLFRAAINYLHKRGITEEDCVKFNIHYSILDSRVLFPSYDSDHELNYYVTRIIDDESTYKYNNPDVSKSDIIFNEYFVDWNKELYLVEGVFDYITCRKNAVPLLGSSLSKESALYKKIIQHKTPIVFAFDSDANRKMFKSIENIIMYVDDVSYIDWGKEERDISSMGTEEFEHYVHDHKIKYGFDSQILSRLTM